MLWTICSKNITCKITYNHSACEEHNNPGALVFGFWWNAILVFLPLSSRQIIIWIAAIPSFVLWSHQKSLSTSLGRLDGKVKHHWDHPEAMLVLLPLLPLASEIIIGIAGSEEPLVSGRRGTQGCCWHTQKQILSSGSYKVWQHPKYSVSQLPATQPGATALTTRAFGDPIPAQEPGFGATRGARPSHPAAAAAAEATRGSRETSRHSLY